MIPKLTCSSSGSGSGNELIKYSTCFAFTIRSLTSSFLFATPLAPQYNSNTTATTGDTFEYIGLVILVRISLLRNRNLRADLHKSGSLCQIRDTVGHDSEELRHRVYFLFSKVGHTHTHLLNLILQLGNAVHIRQVVQHCVARSNKSYSAQGRCQWT